VGTNLFIGFIRTLFLFLAGKVRFMARSKGRRLVMEDGEEFEVFRHVRIVGKTNALPEAVFVVRFQPYMSSEKNIIFSLLPMMIFMGFRGFREKFWAVDRKTGLCQGLYEWQTVKDAENYSKSIAVRFMSGRSVPGTVDFRIIDESKDRYWAFR
jgi:hypothetical protein